jgi:phage N-6-adenine-methyltransferase
MGDMSVHFSSDSSEWETQQDLFDELNDEFHFTLDVCASDINHKVDKYFTKEQDGLLQDWSGNVCWMNPVYGEPEYPCKKNCKKKMCVKRGFHSDKYEYGIIDFIRKASQEAMRGTTVVCLIPSRTDTNWFSYIWNHKTHKPRKWVKEVRFIKGRLQFVGADSVAPFASAIVVMGYDNH